MFLTSSRNSGVSWWDNAVLLHWYYHLRIQAERPCFLEVTQRWPVWNSFRPACSRIDWKKCSIFLCECWCHRFRTFFWVCWVVEDSSRCVLPLRLDWEPCWTWSSSISAELLCIHGINLSLALRLDLPRSSIAWIASFQLKSCRALSDMLKLQILQYVPWLFWWEQGSVLDLSFPVDCHFYYARIYSKQRGSQKSNYYSIDFKYPRLSRRKCSGLQVIHSHREGESAISLS